MKEIFVNVEFIDIDNKILYKNDTLIEKTYLNIMEMYTKYIDAVIVNEEE